MQPAPIQVSYMGFPGTTGATYIDYLVTDEVGRERLLLFAGFFFGLCCLDSDAPSLSFQFVSPTRFSHIYSEKLVHLPHCYFVNDYKQVSARLFIMLALLSKMYI
jgi:protein O-GlcNAc transferase